MKKTIIAIVLGLTGLSVLLLAAGARESTSAAFPDQSAFATLIEIPDTSPRRGRPFEVRAALQNRTDHRLHIVHGAPLIYFEIVGGGFEEIQPAVRIMTGVESELLPRSVYDPDTDDTPHGKRTLLIYEPGTYTVTGYAEFSIADHGRTRDYTIRSRTITVKVQ